MSAEAVAESDSARPAAIRGAERGSLEPWIKDEVEYYSHQVEGVRWMAQRRSFILADDMGLGKTIEALTAFAVDVVRGWAETAIIIAPPTLKANWAAEIEKFTRFPYFVLNGTPYERDVSLLKYMMTKGPKILIINYEQAELHKIALGNLRFDIAIYDECHYIKNPEAKRTIAVLELRSRRSFMLTGTPFLNQVNELWCILHRINPDRHRLYGSFVNRYCVFGGGKYKSIVGVKNEPELRQIIDSVMLRRLKSEVLDLPEVQIIHRSVDLHYEQQVLYDEVFEDFRLTHLDGTEEEIDNALTRFLRLQEISGSTMKFTGEDVSAKLDLATFEDAQLLKEGHKVVVFTQFRHVQNAYVERMKGTGIPLFAINGETNPLDRLSIANKWAKIDGPAIFIPTLKVAAEGLNLVAARHGSFLDKLFVPGKNQQAIDRLHRIGQGTQPVQIRQYFSRNTVEARVEEINQKKSALFDRMINSPSWKRDLLKMVLEGGDD